MNDLLQKWNNIRTRGKALGVHRCAESIVKLSKTDESLPPALRRTKAKLVLKVIFGHLSDKEAASAISEFWVD
jgi:hypothetical protein